MDYLYDKEKGVGIIKVSERASADIKLNAIVKDLAPFKRNLIHSSRLSKRKQCVFSGLAYWHRNVQDLGGYVPSLWQNFKKISIWQQFLK